MVGKGLANIVAGIMQGYPVSGSFSRTAIAFDAGAKTGFAAVVSGIIVGITLLFLTPLMYHLPIATLAAVKQKYGDHVDIEHLQRHMPVDSPERRFRVIMAPGGPGQKDTGAPTK